MKGLDKLNFKEFRTTKQTKIVLYPIIFFYKQSEVLQATVKTPKQNACACKRNKIRRRIHNAMYLQNIKGLFICRIQDESKCSWDQINTIINKLKTIINKSTIL